MASRLRPPGLGPIVGHTTEKTAHIWVRADDQIKDPYEARTRTLAVLGVFRENGKKLDPTPCFYFRLQREFARTGRIVLGHEKVRWRGKRYPMKANTRYEVRIGILVLDDPAPMFDGMSDDELIERLPKPEVWIDDLPFEQALERPVSQPTVNIEGLVGGYTGPGGKTVLPH